MLKLVVYRVDEENCPLNDWGFNGQCYYFNANSMNFEDANTKCKALNHEFVTILGQKVQNYINWQAYGVESWIGIRLVNGNWQWNSNGEIVKPTFTNWENQKVPTDPAKACAIIDASKNGVWRAVSCTDIKMSICQMAAPQ
ncbi:unnamed protein product, partial [Mesorhabditis belari]|uniref:C-type lectin domain-containing protein n=1 Tax=Mesorhabditis belari TaxID=2138241 RepID=A0AAF3FCT8_9BILA